MVQSSSVGVVMGVTNHDAHCSQRDQVFKVLKEINYARNRAIGPRDV